MVKMNKVLFQVPAIITKITTMSKWLRMTVDTQEVVNPDYLQKLFSMNEKLGWFNFSSHFIEPEDIVDLPPIKVDSKKTPSERLRAVLFRLWEQDNMNYDDFNLYYQYYMGRLIDNLKEKLN